MWTDQNGMHNVILVRSTLGQQLHSLLSLDILVMPNFNFCFKKKLPSALRADWQDVQNQTFSQSTSSSLGVNSNIN